MLQQLLARWARIDVAFKAQVEEFVRFLGQVVGDLGGAFFAVGDVVDGGPHGGKFGPWRLPSVHLNDLTKTQPTHTPWVLLWGEMWG